MGRAAPGHNRAVTTTGTTERFRCAAASFADAEPMAGTAPTETSYLFVEHPGPWGRKAVDESRLPDEVRHHLAALSASGVRVQLVRRYGGRSGPGIRVFTADLAGPPTIHAAVLDDVRHLLDLDEATDLTVYDDLLWLVCTNGRRDQCCAETGRPVARALAERWPEQTWETTHLGGHRFAATLLALPSGVTLGRLDEGTARAACARIAAGGHPVAHSRGLAGLDPRAQVADLHLREHLGLDVLDAVRTRRADGDVVVATTRDATYRVTVAQEADVLRRQSCADLTTKAAPVYRVAAVGTVGNHHRPVQEDA